MNFLARIQLQTNAAQSARLRELQIAFAEVCNALVPIVRETRVWNRVALHHLAYKDLRARFPAIGSQMVCNAIYSVSRACRIVFQSPTSPFHLSRLVDQPLPNMQFLEASPVYFDRHTLSIKRGQVSMYTLDGRMRFELALSPEDECSFHHRKLFEILLQRVDGQYFLNFRFGERTGSENRVVVEPTQDYGLENNPISPVWTVGRRLGPPAALSLGIEHLRIEAAA